ncbi:MAG: NAD(P)H-dependent oxidoreductase [Microcoleus sp.]
MKFAIVSGSHRPNSESSKVAQFLAKILETEFPDSKNILLDLGKEPLPEWEESKWDEEAEKWKKIWEPISNQLKQCDALIVVSPEWGGMVPPQLKNFFLLCGDYELGHKPGLIVSVSASRGGAYPVAELRMSSYKNTYLLWIPDHVIIRDVENVLNEHFQANSKEDQYIQDRLLYSLKVLHTYAQCLIPLRASGVIDYDKYPYGM